MKKLINIAVIIVLMACMASCDSSGVGGKFVGKWRPLKSSLLNGTAIIVIRRDGKDYSLASENPRKVITTLSYNRTDDCLTGDIGGIAMIVNYHKKTRHITLWPKSMGVMDQLIELERAK